MTTEMDKVAVDITPLFYSREAMTTAAGFCLGDKNSIVYAWARIELERGAQARIQANTTMLQNTVLLESRFAATAGFNGMEKAGMIVVVAAADKKAKKGRTVAGDRILTDDHFQTFWKRMPERTTESGKKTRGVKANAKRAFFVHIQTLEDFENLLRACDEYATVANGFPKDAERFVRIYEEFVPADGAGTSVAARVPAATAEDKRRIQAQRERELNETV